MQLPWISELRRAASEISVRQPLIVALATVDLEGRPRVRSVAIRNLEADGSLWFTCDSRSEKVARIQGRNDAEMVAWMPAAREQFRFFGKLQFAEPPTSVMRQELWRGLSDVSRAMFFWPAPGSPRTEPEVRFLGKAGPDIAIPETFTAMFLKPSRVEQLIVATHPHERRVWRAENNWNLERINP